MSPQRIGVFGGTFDPVHNGHLMIALEVRHALDLDRMLLVVANDPWQKSARVSTPAAIRLEMVAEAVREVNGRTGADLLEACDLEIERGGPTYTADTLRELHRRLPGAELFLLVGSDAAAGLDTWHEPAVVRDLARTVVVERGGRAGGRPPVGWPHEVVAVPQMEISSSDLRRRFGAGEPTAAFVPPTVSADVVRFGLYGVGGE